MVKTISKEIQEPSEVTERRVGRYSNQFAVDLEEFRGAIVKRNDLRGAHKRTANVYRIWKNRIWSEMRTK